MRLTIIESPYAGDIERHIFYARRAMRHSLLLGEAPYASHLLYTQPRVLRDNVPHEREMGLARGHWFIRAFGNAYTTCYLDAMLAVYTDYGISGGMRAGIDCATKYSLPIVYRKIGLNGEGE